MKYDDYDMIDHYQINYINFFYNVGKYKQMEGKTDDILKPGSEITVMVFYGSGYNAKSCILDALNYMKKHREEVYDKLFEDSKFYHALSSELALVPNPSEKSTVKITIAMQHRDHLEQERKQNIIKLLT